MTGPLITYSLTPLARIGLETLSLTILAVLPSLTLKKLVADVKHSRHDARPFSIAGLLGELDDVIAGG